jgi:hypothetical protein
MRLFRFFMFFNLIFFTGLSTSWADDTASIQGKVVDSSGAIIPQAAISLTDLEPTL